MSNHDNDTPDKVQAQSSSDTGAGVAPNDLQDIVETITGKLRNEERRHAGALQNMMSRLAMLGAEAHIARYRVPEAYQPALKNIQSGLKELSSRIAEAGGDDLAEATPVSEGRGNVPATHSNIASDLQTPAALMSDASSTDRPLAGPSKNDMQTEAHSFDAVGDTELDDQDPSNPWDAVSADALARIYESGEAGHAAPLVQAEETTPVDHGSVATDSFSTDPAPANTSPLSVAQSEPSVPQQHWLEDRFAEIANRIEGNGEPTAADVALNSLAERFDALESRFSSAMDDVATKADLGGLSIVEAHINEINSHLEETQTKFVKLDNIEAQLTAVMERLSGDQTEGGMQLSPQAVEEVAMAAAEQAAMKLAVNAQDAGPHEERMAELQHSLQNFMDERRQGEIESQSMMETMQHAMARMLDRVDTIESGTQERYVAQSTFSPEATQDPAGYQQSAVDHHGEMFEQSVEPGEPTEFEGEKIKGVADSFEARMQEIIGQQQSDVEQQSAARVDIEPSEPEQTYQEPYSGDENGEHVLPEGDVGTDFEAGGSFTNLEDVAPTHFEEQSYQDQAPTELTSELPVGETASSNFEIPPAPEMPAAHVPEFEAEPATDEEHDAGMDHAVSSQALVPPAPVPPRPQVSTSDSITKMRQDLIANAQKAKLEAAAEAGRQMDEGKKKKGLGLSLSFRKKSKDAHETEANGEEETNKGGGLFGLTKRKLIVSMFIAVCTAPAFAAMMDTPMGESFLTDIMLNSTHQAAGKVPLGAEPARVHSDDVLNPEQVRPGVAPAKLIDGQGKRRTVDLGDGYQGQIIDDVAKAEITAARLASNTPAGMTVYDSGKVITPGLISHFEKRDDLAKRSAQLGKFAVPVMPAALSNELNNDVTQPETNKPLLKGSARGALGLPPAKVGPLSLRLAAAKGDPSAQFQVATRLAEGKGNAQDFRLAADWFRRSAQQGFAQSQYRLGTLSERGLGVKKDTARAKIWYQRAAKQGNLKSMHNMAVLSANPSNGRAPDYAAAAQWFVKAADSGLADSQFNLAVLYENGLGVAKNLQRAYKYFALAAKSGDAESARRRDAVIAMLDVEDLTQAENLVKSFKRKRSVRLANDALAAGQAWKKNSTGANYVN